MTGAPTFAALPFDLQQEIDAHVAATVGRTARTGAQAAGITRQDLKDEAHWIEAEAGIVAVAVAGLAFVAAIVFWKVK